MPKRTDVIVVGAGASGLICAGTAAGRGRRVILLEKMERPARKLMITGKGRCNLTNDSDAPALMSAVKRNPRFLYSAFAAFSPRELMSLVEGLGVPLKVERGSRVFPVSDKSVDVVDALVRFARNSGADILTGISCKSLILDGNRVKGVKTDRGGELLADSVVVCTGGKSYPLTGSTGDGYILARQAGHTVTPLRPSLVPLELSQGFCHDLAGLSLRNVTLTLKRRGGGKALFKEQGELVFTHSGISGPLVLSASAHMDGEASDWSLCLDLKPALTQEQLDARILRDFSANPNKDFSNILPGLTPRSLVPVIIGLSGVKGEAKAHEITKKQRLDLAALFKSLPLTPSGFRPIEEAVITSGGVEVKEVNPKTMQSKLASGLYFSGEVLDVDAYTGGFNLQIAFSTGFLAGQNA